MDIGHRLPDRSLYSWPPEARLRNLWVVGFAAPIGLLEGILVQTRRQQLQLPSLCKTIEEWLFTSVHPPLVTKDQKGAGPGEIIYG